jgi:cytochrome c oxidase assembly protein subunit 15
VGAAEQIGQAQTAMPSGPVTQGKAWVEMIHRYLATAVGVLITALTASAWLARKSGGTGVAVNPWMPTVTLIWVCIQGAFGALTVTMKLFPAIVSLHLLGGYMLLALLTWQAVALQRAETTTSRIVVTLALRRGLIAALVILVLQAASGAWVSTNYAVLACSEFPQCQGGWWPAMHFAQGFELWRPLGMSGDGAHISFQALTAIHFAHRMLAVVTLLVLVSLTAAIWKVSALGYAPKLLAGLLALQAITGISNVVLDWPLIAAVLHTGGAGALLVVLVGLIATTKPSTATNPGFVFPRSLTQ